MEADDLTSPISGTDLEYIDRILSARLKDEEVVEEEEEGGKPKGKPLDNGDGNKFTFFMELIMKKLMMLRKLEVLPMLRKVLKVLRKAVLKEVRKRRSNDCRSLLLEIKKIALAFK